MTRHRRVLGSRHDDAADVLEAPQRVHGEERVHGVEAEARAVRLEVLGPARVVLGEAAHDLVRVARRREHALPDLRVRGVRDAVPPVGHGRGQDHGAAGRTRRVHDAAQVAEARGHEREDRVHEREDRVGARVRHAPDEDVEALAREVAPRRVEPRHRLEHLAPRLPDAARHDLRDVPGVGQERVQLEHAAAQARLEVAAHLVEHRVHAVVADRHGHAVRRVGDADRLPGREPHADRLPAAVEAAVVAGVDVDGQVRVGDQAVDLHRIAVLRRAAEVHERVAVLGVVAGEASPELRDELVAEQAHELARAELPVERVGAHQPDPRPRHAGLRQLVEHGLDRDAPDRAVGGDGGVVEGDRDRGGGPDEVAQAREAAGLRERRAHRRGEVGHGRERPRLGGREDAGAVGQGGGQGALRVRDLDPHGGHDTEGARRAQCPRGGLRGG